MKGRISLCAGALAVGLVSAACSASNDAGSAALSETSPDASAPATSTGTRSKDPRMEAWKNALFTSPPGREGCFHTSYPSTAWIEEPCAPPPTDPVLPRHMPAPFDAARADEDRGGNVGNGPDFILQSPTTIESAVGSFPSVTGATSATSIQPDGSTIPGGYSIQMNSNTFTVPGTNPYCNKSSGCTGWQQVLYSNVAAQTGVYFQYWLLGYGTTCPNASWVLQPGSTNCRLNSASVSGVPLLPISDLSQIAISVQTGVTLDGGAGNDDVLTFTLEGTSPPATAQAHAQQFPTILGLQGNWKQVEFGVFGDLNLDNVNLGNNTTIETEVQSYPLYPNVSCLASGGTTGETNNLNQVPNCCVVSGGGDITFLESNVPGQTCPLCGAQDQPCCAVGTACSSSYDYCDSTTKYCEEIELCPGGCPSGYICEAPNGPPGVCVVNHRCIAGEKYCNGKCIPQSSFCP